MILLCFFFLGIQALSSATKAVFPAQQQLASKVYKFQNSLVKFMKTRIFFLGLYGIV